MSEALSCEASHYKSCDSDCFSESARNLLSHMRVDITNKILNRSITLETDVALRNINRNLYILLNRRLFSEKFKDGRGEKSRSPKLERFNGDSLKNSKTTNGGGSRSSGTADPRKNRGQNFSRQRSPLNLKRITQYKAISKFRKPSQQSETSCGKFFLRYDKKSFPPLQQSSRTCIASQELNKLDSTEDSFSDHEMLSRRLNIYERSIGNNQEILSILANSTSNTPPDVNSVSINAIIAADISRLAESGDIDCEMDSTKDHQESEAPDLPAVSENVPDPNPNESRQDVNDAVSSKNQLNQEPGKTTKQHVPDEIDVLDRIELEMKRLHGSPDIESNIYGYRLVDDSEFNAIMVKFASHGEEELILLKEIQQELWDKQNSKMQVDE